MDYGQPVNNPNQEPFFTAGSGNVLGNPDIDKSLNTDAYSPERDPRTMGNTAFSSANQEIFSQPPEATTEINGDLRAKPVNITSTPELVPAPIVDPNSVQLGELIEMNASNQESSTTLANFVEIDKDGEISKKTINTVIEETRKYERPGSSIHPADIVDMKDQATEDYQTAREESSRIKKETT